MEGSASIGATQSAVMRSSRFRSSRATLSSTTGSAPWVLECTVRVGKHYLETTNNADRPCSFHASARCLGAPP